MGNLDEVFNKIFTEYLGMLQEQDIDKVCTLFDDEDFSLGDNQRIINGLALLLTGLEKHIEEDTCILGVPLLCKMKALSAAYHLGQTSQKLVEVI